MAKKKQRAKRRVMGLMGKAGVVVMAVPPIVGPALTAFKMASVQHSVPDANPTLGTRIDMFFRGWINGVSKGFSLGVPFPTIKGFRVDGSSVSWGLDPDIPDGVWWKTTASGGVMLLVDRVVAALVKRPVKFPGTNFTITGN